MTANLRSDYNCKFESGAGEPNVANHRHHQIIPSLFRQKIVSHHHHRIRSQLAQKYPLFPTFHVATFTTTAIRSVKEHAEIFLFTLITIMACHVIHTIRTFGN